MSFLPPSSGGLYSQDEIAVWLEVKNSETLTDAAKKTDTLKSSLTQLDDSLEKSAKSHANFGRATLESGRALQDFAQGGIGGVLNNIEGLSLALGGGPGLAGIMTAVGLAAFFALPHLKSWFAALSGGGDNPVPQAVTQLGRYKDALKDVDKELEELKKKQSLTNDELKRFNDLTSYQLDLEKRVTEEQDKKKARDKLAELPKKSTEEQDKERAEILQAAMGDRSKRIERDLELAAEYQLRRAQQTPLGSPEHAAASAAYEEFTRLGLIHRPGAREARQDLIAAAMVEGNAEAIRKLTQLIPGQGFEQALPGAIEAGEKEVTDEEARAEKRHLASLKRQRGREAWNEQLAKRKRVDRNLEKATNEGVENLDSLEQQQKQDTATAKQRARENSATARLARQKSDLEEKATVTAQDLNRRQQLGLRPDQVDQLAHGIIDQMGPQISTAAAVQRALFLFQQKMTADRQRDNSRIVNYAESFLGP